MTNSEFLIAPIPGGRANSGMTRDTLLRRWTNATGGLAISALLLASSVAPAAEPFFFIQLSDPQFGMFTDNQDFAQETANFEFAVATVNRLRPAFVVITGDLVNKPGDAAQIAEYQRILRRIDSAIPVYNVAGNHDIENVPTPGDITAYTNQFGPDQYTFRHAGFVGIVLDSVVIHSPQQTTNQLAEQERWLRAELERARESRAQHVVIFAHHPWFLKTASEPDEYFNIPRERRAIYLKLFHESGVRHLFSGHYHRNAVARDGDLEAVTTGPVGKPLGEGKSGLRVVIVRDDHLEHRYYDFGEVPKRIELGAVKP
jgi:3',5'-cyclic AMP phosphodiesterase CpdA